MLISITIYILQICISVYMEKSFRYIHMQIHIFVAITSVLVESRPLGLSSTTESPEHAWNYEVSTVGRHHKKHCVQRRQVFFYGGN